MHVIHIMMLHLHTAAILFFMLDNLSVYRVHLILVIIIISLEVYFIHQAAVIAVQFAFIVVNFICRRLCMGKRHLFRLTLTDIRLLAGFACHGQVIIN